MNKQLQNSMIFLSSLFPVFLLGSILLNYNSNVSKKIIMIGIFGFIIHVIFGPIMRIYQLNILFSPVRNILGFIFCSIGQILLSYLLYLIIDNDKKETNPDNKLSELQKICFYIVIFLLLLNLGMRLYIIISNNGNPLKNRQTIQTLFSHFGTKESDVTKYLCPINFIKHKNICSYIITIIIACIVLPGMINKIKLFK